jgi:hypothetical protein
LSRQSAIVKLELVFQPVVAGDKGALGWLFGPADQFIGKKPGQRGSQLSLWIGFAIRRHEEARIILHAGKAAEQVPIVMQ